MQVRHKGGASGAFLELTRRIVSSVQAYDARVIVNDRADIARLAGAAGVHVGQSDLTVEDVCRVAGPDVLVGVSTHDRDQIDAALAGSAAYVAVGPVYGTTTKDTGYTARGLDLVRYGAGRGRPIVAIGGITIDRVREVMEAGASAVAVISDLLSTGDPEQRTREYLLRCQQAAGDDRI